MMSKDYLKYLESICKPLEKDKRIFDIVVYGSVVKGSQEPRDIDILIIFNDLPLEKRLEIAQEFKNKIKDKIKNIDLKTINLKELFEKTFLAKQGILSEGYSLIYNSLISERIGFRSFMLFTYNLKNLDKNRKTKFIYSLSGRNTEGILKKIKAEHLGKGVILVPTDKSIIFEDFLKQWDVNYSVKKTLIEK